MIHFRPHRGTLMESIAAAQDFATVERLAEHLSREIGLIVTPPDLIFKAIGPDPRVSRFEQYLVVISDVGVAGFALTHPGEPLLGAVRSVDGS